MPGLNSNNIEWNNSSVRLVAEDMLAKYKQISQGPANGDKFAALYTPYQFTIPLLQALYFQFEKAGEELEAEIEKNMRDGVLKANNPKSRELAFNTSLRAIAYLSWEAESRAFLVRRVFPTYFDFLSVSHIPEGWGVSSIMLERLQKNFDDEIPVVNGSFFETVDVEDKEHLSHTLPYLAEQIRLRYRKVLILPVFRPDEDPKSDRDMLGTFLFFTSGTDGVPRKNSGEESQFRWFANCLCKATAELVAEHNLALTAGTSPLPKHWRDKRAGRKAEAGIAEVILSCDHPDRPHQGKPCTVLESAAREFLKALTVPNYYAIRDLVEENARDNNVAVFLLTARPRVELKDFKRRLLRIVTERLSEVKVICEINIQPGGSKTCEDFQLKADKWGI